MGEVVWLRHEVQFTEFREWLDQEEFHRFVQVAGGRKSIVF